MKSVDWSNAARAYIIGGFPPILAYCHVRDSDSANGLVGMRYHAEERIINAVMSMHTFAKGVCPSSIGFAHDAHLHCSRSHPAG
jgi:hypothetical protein